MSLELDPVELGFRRPFTQEVDEKLRLRNPNSDPVAFKVKTTAPKQYCVRPNSGRIEAGQEVEVSVLLQAMKEEPPMDAKCRDKFLVQSVAVSASDEFTSVAEVWSNIEKTAKSSIQEKKIRVNFLPSSGVLSTPSRTSTSALASDDHPPAYSSPMSTAQTPQQSSNPAPVGAVSTFDSKPADSKNVSEVKSSTSNPAYNGQSSVSAAAASVAGAVPTSTEELKAQLAAAQSKIASLTNQASEGLRQRKSEAVSKDTSNSTSSALGMQQAPSGVPVPVVAGLCLLSFLLAYLLF